MIIFILDRVGRLQVTAMSWEVVRVMAPLVVISLVNVLAGLGGTQKVSLPMFTALRRFSILMTMLLEAYVFGTSPSTAVKMSVFMMIIGALVAAMSDLSFDTVGYAMILLSDLFTALNGVVMKKTLSSSSTVNKMAVLYYNSLFGVVMMGLLMMLRDEELARVREFRHWQDPHFVLYFFLAGAMGSVLNYSIFLCTLHNSALTTTVVGCLKNILTTYIGMFLISDYIFSWENFLGIHISIAGSLVYSYVELQSILNNKERPGTDLTARKKLGRIHHPGKLADRSSKREAEMIRLMEQRPPSGGGRPEHVSVDGQEKVMLV
ncbi:hypothetical protein NSK_001070 [Nannochloropsis salina CCMP1776]|uniref:Sugar phosphate transporter domain-containing protein n=1 Tax=Nannochloropsis salina CCMP1776 TaxID=1027361 RepID=A0A4D9D8H2_9STRA|nr:hypothetical protein NSK_001070 [Nannochloropsis salina CCMP1776]|eukprot:TFJ87720.1 hypothetical protein NSK_001070 [Nannochloropsis salina CCMP1776]